MSTNQGLGNDKQRSAECLTRFLMWARDEAVQVLEDKVTSAGLDVLCERLIERFNIDKDELLKVPTKEE